YGSVTNSCRYSRAALSAGAQSVTSSRRPASAGCRARAINSVPYSIDRHRRIERIVEVLRADIEPLGHEAQLIGSHEACVRGRHAARTGGDTREELRRRAAVRTAGVHDRGVRWSRDGSIGPHDNGWAREQQLLIRSELLRFYLGRALGEIEITGRRLRLAHRILRIVAAALRAGVVHTGHRRIGPRQVPQRLNVLGIVDDDA